MDIGTTVGLFRGHASGAPRPSPELAERRIEHLSRVGGVVYAGTDAGLFASRDRDRSWQFAGLAGYEVWNLAPSPTDPQTLFAVTQPAALSARGTAACRGARSSPSDECRTPSFGITPDPDTVGGVLVGTDLGEVWRVTPGAAWTRLAAGLPDVQAVCSMDS